MWVLKRIREGPNESEKSPYHLVVGEYLVGRKGCAIQVSGDQTVSRKHAYITVNHSGSAHASATQVTLKDISKFGTVVNKVKCRSSVSVQLKDGDVITFGTQDSAYRLSSKPLVVFASCLDNSKKKSLKTNIAKLGGYMVNEWQKECTHLVMDALSFTVKVIYALVSCCPIVKPSYFEDLQGITSNSELPSSENYMPPIKEQLIDPNAVSFCPNEARKTVFAGKTFLFLEKNQYKRLERAITLAGGRALLKECGDFDEDQDLLTDVNTLVISIDLKCVFAPDKEVWVGHVGDVLSSCNRRPIAETEVGLAILHLSLDEFCNSSMKHIPRITKQIVSKSLSTMEAMSQRANESQIISSFTEKKPLPCKRDVDEQKKNAKLSAREENRKRTRGSSSDGDALPLVNDTPLSENIPLENKRQKLSSPVVSEVPRTPPTRHSGRREKSGSDIHQMLGTFKLEVALTTSPREKSQKKLERKRNLNISKSDVTHISQSQDSPSVSGRHKVPKSEVTHISQSEDPLAEQSIATPSDGSQRKSRQNLRLAKPNVTHISQSQDSGSASKEPIVKSEVTHISQSLDSPPEPVQQRDTLPGSLDTKQGLTTVKSDITHISQSQDSLPGPDQPRNTLLGSLSSEKRNLVIVKSEVPSDISPVDDLQAANDPVTGERKRRRLDVPKSELSTNTSQKSAHEVAIPDTPSPEISVQGKRRRVSSDTTHISETERSRTEENMARPLDTSFDWDNSFTSNPAATHKTAVKEKLDQQPSEVLKDPESSPAPKSRETSPNITNNKQTLISKHFIKSQNETSGNIANSMKNSDNNSQNISQNNSRGNETGNTRNGSLVKTPRSGWMSKKSSQHAKLPKVNENNNIYIKVEGINGENDNLGGEASNNENEEVVSEKSTEQGYSVKKEAQSPTEVVVKEEFDIEIPRNLICVEYVELVVPRTAPRKNCLSEKNNVTNLKNTKRFRKQNYPSGGRGLPRIIGGNDLEVFTSTNKSVQDWFVEIQQMNRQRDLEEKDADDLFRYEPPPTKRRGRVAAR